MRVRVFMCDFSYSSVYPDEEELFGEWTEAELGERSDPGTTEGL